MNVDDKVELVDIENKKRNIKLFKIIDLFIRSILTIVGTVSLISLLMFLNSNFGVSYFSCFVMACIIPSFYSLVVNSYLEGFGKKIKNMEYELVELENEYNQLKEKENTKDFTNDSLIEKIEFRFDGLSNERKIQLLNYIKNNIPDSIYFRYMDDLDNLDLINLDDMVKEVYTKKREK